MIEAILFDFDMTLVDSLEVGNKALGDLKHKYGLSLDIAIKNIWGISHIPLMKMVAGLNQNRYAWKKISAWNKSSMCQYYKACKINDLDVLLEIKKRGIYFAIVSNNSREIISEVLSLNGNDKLKFEDVFGNEDFASPESKSEVINFVVTKYGFDKRGVMYVDDSVKGVFAAREAGVIPVAVVSGLHSYDELDAVGPKIILNRLGEIVNYLDL